jgi:hypothetical protein
LVSPPSAGIDHLDLLGAAGLLDNRLEAGFVQQRLEHLVFVGVHGALNDVLAQAPGGIDQHHLVEAGFGVDGEHHAGAADVGADHQLHADRQRHLVVVEALDLAVGDRPVGEQRGVAAPAGRQQRRFAADIEIGFLLAGETRVGQILGGSAGAHGDGEFGVAGAFGELAVGRQDRLADIVGPVARDNGGADRRAGLGQRALARCRASPSRRRSPG